jgi:hypothetical protein
MTARPTRAPSPQDGHQMSFKRLTNPRRRTRASSLLSGVSSFHAAELRPENIIA